MNAFFAAWTLDTIKDDTDPDSFPILKVSIMELDESRRNWPKNGLTPLQPCPVRLSVLIQSTYPTSFCINLLVALHGINI